jgi:hypothetical protein
MNRTAVGLTRQSIHLRRMMDARVKPAHDEPAYTAMESMPHSVSLKKSRISM